MIFKGRVHKFGDNINTDEIITAKYLNISDEKELASHCMENISPSFSKTVRPGDIIVAGKNFGCGSSREHAPVAIKGCGISAVVAESFAAIFFRNAINIGLPFLECEGASEIEDNDILEIDLSSGTVKNLTKGELYHTTSFPEFLQEIVKAGGLMKWLKLNKTQRPKSRRKTRRSLSI